MAVQYESHNGTPVGGASLNGACRVRKCSGSQGLGEKGIGRLDEHYTHGLRYINFLIILNNKLI